MRQPDKHGWPLRRLQNVQTPYLGGGPEETLFIFLAERGAAERGFPYAFILVFQLEFLNAAGSLVYLESDHRYVLAKLRSDPGLMRAIIRGPARPCIAVKCLFGSVFLHALVNVGGGGFDGESGFVSW